MHPGQGRWGLKRGVQPCPQIAIEEELLPQQSINLVQLVEPDCVVEVPSVERLLQAFLII